MPDNHHHHPLSIPTDHPALTPSEGAGPELVQSRSYRSQQTGHVSHEVHGAGPITHARDQLGQPVAPHAFTDDTIITVRGLGEIDYGQAVQLGFVKPPQGARTPETPEGDNPFEADDMQRQDDNDDPDVTADMSPMDRDTEAAITELATAVDAGTQNAIIEAAATGDLDNGAAELIGQEVGQEKFDQIRTAFENQAREAVGAATGLAGDDLQDFIDALYTDRPEAMADAINGQLRNRSTAGYTKLAQQALLAQHEYQGALPQCGEGVTAREVDGRVVVNVRGAEMDLEQAVDLGLVSVERV